MNLIIVQNNKKILRVLCAVRMPKFPPQLVAECCRVLEAPLVLGQSYATRTLLSVMPFIPAYASLSPTTQRNICPYVSFVKVQAHDNVFAQVR
mgnify:CR=1 FL=1